MLKNCCKIIVVVMLVGLGVGWANANTQYWNQLKLQKWEDARNIARAIDRHNKKGDIYLAYTDAFVFLQENECELAKNLAGVVVQVEPGFLPAYDIIITCLIREDNRSDATIIVKNLVNSLDEGVDKEYYSQWAETLENVGKAVVSFTTAVTPSSNVTRSTDRRTGLGGTIPENSRRKSGVIGFGQFNIAKPMKVTQNSRTDLNNILSIAYDTATETLYPAIGLSIRKNWRISNYQNIYVEPRYNRTLNEKDRFLDETRIEIGYSKQWRPDLNSAAAITIAQRNFKDDDRDAIRNNITASIQKTLNQNDKITLNIAGYINNAENSNHNENEISGNVDWQHRFDKGLITTMGLNAGNRRFEANIPLANEKRKDEFYSLIIGLSHEKIKIGDVRPQLTYQAIRQESNDLFRDFTAHNITILFRKKF